MYRINYGYFTTDNKNPKYGKYGKCIKEYVDGESLKEVCDNFDDIRYHHDVVKNSTIDFYSIEEI